MSRYIIRRLLQAIPLLFFVSIILFVLMGQMGDPIATMGGRRVTRPADRERLTRQLGLDQPGYMQYLYWLVGNDWRQIDLDGDGVPDTTGTRRGILRGDFGMSLMELRDDTRPADQVGLGVPYVLGTVPYFASELWRVLDGTSTDAINWFLSDEYAAGVCCYQILCRGRLPPRLEQCAAQGESSQVQHAMRNAHLGGIFFPVRVPEYPGRALTQVDRVLQRMLSINPQNRYGNMTECALAMVTAFINHELMTLGGC